MKSQWIIIVGLCLALFTAIIAVFNVTPVTLDYILGEVEVSLIIVISASILIGGLIVTIFGMSKPYKMKKENDWLKSKNQDLQNENNELKDRIAEVQAASSRANAAPTTDPNINGNSEDSNSEKDKPLD